MPHQIKFTPRKFLVTIGIPVFRDSGNIRILIHRLLSQSLDHALLERVVVVSDPTKKITNSIVDDIHDKRLILISDMYRPYRNTSINRILRNFSGDILVLMDNEILPRDHFTLNDLITPFTENKSKEIGLVLGVPVFIDPRSFSEKITYHYHQLKNNIYSGVRNGRNIYLVDSRFGLAMSKSMAINLDLPENVPVDDYIYFHARKSGLQIKKSSAEILILNHRIFSMKLPRYIEYPDFVNNLQQLFPRISVDSEYEIPFKIIAREIIKSFRFYPHWTLMVILVQFYSRFSRFISQKSSAIYEY